MPILTYEEAIDLLSSQLNDDGDDISIRGGNELNESNTVQRYKTVELVQKSSRLVQKRLIALHDDFRLETLLRNCCCTDGHYDMVMSLIESGPKSFENKSTATTSREVKDCGIQTELPHIFKVGWLGPVFAAV